jgi:Ca-activated chloride channel family protein
MGESYYSILGVTSSASAEQIRLAYIELAKKYHPDSSQHSRNSDIFIVIQHAYEVLSKPKTRKDYDLSTKLNVCSRPPIELNWKFSRNEVPRIAESQIVYGKLDIRYSGNQEDFKTPPSHLCIVLDRSTSMKGERLDTVRKNLRQLITELRDVDLISIVVFNDKAEILIAPTSTGDQNALFKKIDTIQAAGGTEIYRGLKAGIDILWQGFSTEYLPNLLLLTDGHTYGDEERCIDLAHKAIEKNIRISALGFGNDWNDNFLDTVTSITGGCTYYVKTLFDLPRLLLFTLKSLKTTIAHNMNLEIDNTSSAIIKYCFKLDPEIVQLQNDEPIQLGSLLKEIKSTYIFAFELPALSGVKTNIPLLNGRIRFLMGDKKENSFVEEQKINISVGDNPEKSSIPVDIVQSLSRITLYQMQEKSHTDVQRGNVVDAVRRLTYMATHLIGQGNVSFAKEVLNEAENIKKEQSYSEDGNKRLKYGTRALLQLPEPEKRTQ